MKTKIFAQRQILIRHVKNFNVVTGPDTKLPFNLTQYGVKVKISIRILMLVFYDVIPHSCSECMFPHMTIDHSYNDVMRKN